MKVPKIWNDPKYLQEEDIQCRFTWKLKDLKVMTKVWAKAMSERIVRELENLEHSIKNLLNQLPDGSISNWVEKDFIDLESKRNKLLIDREEHWRIKSRAIWIKSRDLNTNFFHQFDNQRRINKHLWEIKDDSGEVYKGQKKIINVVSPRPSPATDHVICKEL
jgi:hypothetical protein